MMNQTMLLALFVGTISVSSVWTSPESELKLQTKGFRLVETIKNKDLRQILHQLNEYYSQVFKDLIQTSETQNKEIKDLREKLRVQEEKLKECSVWTKQNFEDEIKAAIAAAKKDLTKRIVLHSDIDILNIVTLHSAEIQNLQNNMTQYSGDVTTVRNDVSAMKKELAIKVSGSTYVAWGKKRCPNVNGTELVYSGFAGGSYYTNSGAASNYICLSPDPQWGYQNDAHNAGAQVNGAEYELNSNPQFSGTNIHEEDVPCSVCRSSRPTVIMIPGRKQCYSGWTMEYNGYLTAGYSGHAAASEYVCLDGQPEVLQGGHPDMNGKLFYFVEGRCGSLPCPPYIDGRELTCVCVLKMTYWQL